MIYYSYRYLERSSHREHHWQISRAYEVRGMVTTITSYDNPTVGSGTALNEVKMEYNSFGQLIKESQEHGGLVTTSSLNVQYAYADGSSSSNQIRATGMTYPNGRVISQDYGTSGGLDDLLNRVNAIKDGTTTLAAYTYLGSGTVVRIDYTQPSVMLDLWGGVSGTFDGIDRFGRVIDQRWRYYGATPADRDRYQYGYDRNSNRTWKQNCVGSALDEYYTYDDLNRLTNMDRGTLNTGKTAIDGTPAVEQDWTLDPTGNWSAFQTKTNGTTDLNQTRTANPVNEITAIGGTPDWADPTYDAAGNTITFPKADNPSQNLTAVYDAWNRMTQVADGTNTVAGYQYDGKGRKIKTTAYSNHTASEIHDYIYSIGFQNIEEHISISENTIIQYINGIRYIDEYICRDIINDTENRVFVCQDACFNTTSIIDVNGNTLEYYLYDAYGNLSVLNSSQVLIPISQYSWKYCFHGLEYDIVNGILYNRMRWVYTLSGLYLQRDYEEYVDGFNLYSLLAVNPVIAIDPIGLSCTTFDRTATMNVPFKMWVDGGWWQVSYGMNVSYGLSIEKCDTCCPDGKLGAESKVTIAIAGGFFIRYTIGREFSGKIKDLFDLFGNKKSLGSWKDSFQLYGYVGLRTDVSLNIQLVGTLISNSCSGNNSSTELCAESVGVGRISGGFNLTAQWKWWSYSIGAEIYGDISAGSRVCFNCGKDNNEYGCKVSKIEAKDVNVSWGFKFCWGVCYTIPMGSKTLLKGG